MKWRIEATAAVLAGVIALGCEQPPPSAPTFTGPLFAAATTTDITATASLTITDLGRNWISDGIIHFRDQVQEGTVSGGISGTVRVVGRSDVTIPPATGTGTASGKVTITVTSGGTWEGSFEGRFDGGLFSGKLVAQGTGALAGQILRGSVTQTLPNRDYALTATILNPGG